MESFENTNITTDENIKNVTEVITEPQIADDFKDCIFCGQKIKRDMLFCSFCGRPQQRELKKEERKKKVRRKIKKRPVKKGMLFTAMAYVFFALSFLCMIIGIYRMNFMNVTTISLFGSNSDLIVNQTHVIGNLILSFIYLISGIFFIVLRFLKSVSSGITDKIK